MALGIGEPVRGREAPNREASARARALRRSVCTLRVRVAYMGAKFGSATTTSWPTASKHRATHSLSVEASRRMRAGARAQHLGKAAGIGTDPALKQFDPLD